MVCIYYSPKFLSLNPLGIKFVIPLYIKVAKSIILEESFLKKEFVDLTKIIGSNGFEQTVNDIKFQAIGILKLSYELTKNFSNFFSINEIKNEIKKFGSLEVLIFEITLDILNRIAYENEIFKIFDNNLKRNIFSLVMLILKNFEEAYFKVFF